MEYSYTFKKEKNVRIGCKVENEEQRLTPKTKNMNQSAFPELIEFFFVI